jgi:hypothetical protein
MNKTWKQGDKVTYYGSKITRDVHNGLFWYSGFGMGKYFSVSGEVVWCSVSEGSDMAKKEGLTFQYEDSFNCHGSIGLKD